MARGWARRRARQLARFPTCAKCGAAASAVDHVLARSEGGGDEAANLQSLCASCHAAKTGREGQRAALAARSAKAIDPIERLRRRAAVAGRKRDAEWLAEVQRRR